MTDTDLKPCPFCGSDNVKSGGDDKVVGVWCLNCEATGPNGYLTVNGEHDWNTRPSPTREEIAVNPLEWDGLVSGAYEIRIEEGGIADLYFYGERDEDGNPVLLQGAYLTLIDLDEFKEIAQKHHAEQMAKLVNVTPSPVGEWRDFHDWWSTDGHAMDPEPDVSWYDKRRDFAEMAFNAARTPAPGQQPSDPWSFDEPYSLKREETALSGTVFWLMSNGVSIASYAVSNWGSEDACIKAAWRHAYEPEQPSVAEAARVLGDDDYAVSFLSYKLMGSREEVKTALRTLQGDG